MDSIVKQSVKQQRKLPTQLLGKTLAKLATDLALFMNR